MSALRTARLAVATVILTLLAGCTPAGAGDAGSPTETARHAAERYLGYLASGDATSAAAMIPSVSSHPEKVFAGTELLADEVLAAAESRIEGVTITGETPGAGTSVSFAVRYTLAGTAHDTELSMRVDDGAWVVDSGSRGALVVELSPPAGDPVPARFEIAGRTVEIAENGRPAFLLFPGVYRITVDVPEALVVDPAATPLVQDVVIGFALAPVRVTIPVTGTP